MTALAIAGGCAKEPSAPARPPTARSSQRLAFNPLSASFTPAVLAAQGEAPLALRLFISPVKTDSQGEVITGQNSDPVKKLVGAEAAGERGGMQRFTRITFANKYDTGEPDKGTRIDPNHVAVHSGSQLWPFREQPFRSWPSAVAITPDGSKVYAALQGREGYPDWRVAVMNTATKAVTRWVDLRLAGQTRGVRPVNVQASPLNLQIRKNPYLVVVNQYANYASVIDSVTDTVIGEFETGFYGEELLFNATGTRLYVSDRFKDQVRAFRIDAGPSFTQIAQIPTGTNLLDRANPRDMSLSADGNTLYVANTLGHTLAVIDVTQDANILTRNIVVGGLPTDVKVAGRWGIIAGHATNNVLNGPETGHGLPTMKGGTWIRSSGAPLGYTPVMGDATRATTFDDLGSELNVFDTATNRFVFRYVDFERDLSMLAVPGQVTDLGDHSAAQKVLHGSGPEQLFVRGDLLFVSFTHSDSVEVYRINQNPTDPSKILTRLTGQLTGGISPQGLVVSPDGSTVYVANLNTEDVSYLRVNTDGSLTRQGFTTVGVASGTVDPSTGDGGKHLFATDEEVGLRWIFSSAYSDDGQKSCGFCHWQSRSDGSQWNVGANAVGGTKNCPQNKDISDNWPEWYEGLSNNLKGYASSCSGELAVAERLTALFNQPNELDRYQARNAYTLRKTAENSTAIGRPELTGKAFSAPYEELSYLEILWAQNETRRMPNPLTQAPTPEQASTVARGKFLFTAKVSSGGAGCADCHHNGNVVTNGAVDDTLQDFNIHEPGVVSEHTVDGNGPFLRLKNDYFLISLGPPQDEGSRQNISARNTKHLRSFWDSAPRWLHHGDAHSLREILLPPDSPLLEPQERGFNFRTVRTDHQRAVDQDYLRGPVITLPTEVPITFADSSGSLGGDGKGPILVSLDSPTVILPDGMPQIDQLGTSNLAPLIVLTNGVRTLNPALAANHIQVIKDTHGKTSALSASDLDALGTYLVSLQ